MKRAELTCDKCKGTFECANSLDEYICPYCGNKVIVEMSASKLGVKGALAYFTRKNELKEERKQRELEAKIEAEKAKQREQWKWFAAMIGILVALAIVYIVAEAIEPEESSDANSSTAASSTASESEPSSESGESTSESDAASSPDSSSATDPNRFTVVSTNNQADVSSGEKVKAQGRFSLHEITDGRNSTIVHDGKSYYLSIIQKTTRNAYDYFELRAYELSPQSLELLSQYEDEYFRHVQYPSSKQFTASIQGTTSVKISRGRLAEEDNVYSETGGWILDDAELIEIRVS